MIGDALKSILNRYPRIIKQLDEGQVTYALKEIIILEIIQHEGETTSQEIQKEFLEVLDPTFIHETLLEPAISSPLKSRLKVNINNILSSNLFHSNGLSNRPEIKIEKRGTTYYYKISDILHKDLTDLFDTEDKYVDIIKMGAFIKKYPYIMNFVRIFGFNKDYCEMNSLHIHEKGYFPIYLVTQYNDFSSITNIRFICRHCIADLMKKELNILLERSL